MELILFLLGNVTLSADYANAMALLNICMYYGVTYTQLKTHPDRITMRLRYTEFMRLRKLCRERNIEYTVEKKQGIPAIVMRYKHRYGIAVGALCALLLVFLAHRYVWSIEVEGNKTLTSAEVCQLLGEKGFTVGSLISQANTDRIENKVMIDSDRIAWMSINIIGTVAHVQIREYEGAPKKDTVTKPANLVASKAGVIEEVRLFRGNAVVCAGKYVEKGELLVSGLFDSERVGFRYTRAAGTVLARTEEEFYIEIPYEYEQRVYTGEQYCEKYLNFFDFSMNISKKCGKEGTLYDKIDIVENFDLFGFIKTPLSWRTVKYVAYQTETATRSKDEAEAIAYFRLSELLGDVASDRIIIKKTVTPAVKQGKFTLSCTVVSIENIAEVSEFDIDLDGE